MSGLKFKINIAAGLKKTKTNNTFVKVSTKVEAVVILDKGEFKARIISSPVEDTISEYRVLPFTPNSFKLRNRRYVFLKHKDRYGHNQVVIRDADKAYQFPGLDSHYSVFIENIVINGFIVKRDNKYYFDYIDLVAFRENGHRLTKPKIKKKDE